MGNSSRLILNLCLPFTLLWPAGTFTSVPRQAGSEIGILPCRTEFQSVESFKVVVSGKSFYVLP